MVLQGVPDQPGISHQVFSAIAEKNIVVDMIAQNVGSGGRASIGFTVLANELPATLAVLRPLAAGLGATVEHEEDVSKVSVVGTGMRTHTGVAERMFAALAAADITLKMITTGDIKISVLVDRVNAVKALRAVHDIFGLRKPHPGAGLPGKTGQAPFRDRPPEVVLDGGRDLAALPSTSPAWRTSWSATCCSAPTRPASPSSTCPTNRVSALVFSRCWRRAASWWT